jgi:hypothetical protein
MTHPALANPFTTAAEDEERFFADIEPPPLFLQTRARERL